MTLEWLARLNGRHLPHELVITAADSRTAQQLEADAGALSAHDNNSRWRKSAATAAADPATAPTADVHDTELQLDDSSDCTALLQDQLAANKACGGQQQLAGHDAAARAADCHHNDGILSVFSHPLMSRYFLVTMLLCMVMATTFYLANLATDTLGGSLYLNFLLTSAGECRPSWKACTNHIFTRRWLVLFQACLRTGFLLWVPAHIGQGPS